VWAFPGARATRKRKQRLPVRSGRPARRRTTRKPSKRAGGEAVLIPLKDEAARNRLIPTLDAFVLPGSSADINPREIPRQNRGQSKKADKQREDADKAVLKLAIAEKKAGTGDLLWFQMLNVHQRGSLVRTSLKSYLSGRTPPPMDLPIPKQERKAAAISGMTPFSRQEAFSRNLPDRQWPI